jgi:hypothetical protein
MKQSSFFGFSGLALALVLVGGNAIAQTRDVQPPRSQTQEAETTTIQYNPPLRGSPTARIGASTRGMVNRELTIEVLAPDHEGFSTTAQPVLYWYLSQPVKMLLEVTIDTHDLTVRSGPLLEVMLKQDQKAGISSINLRDFGVRLAPDVTYRWSVAAIIDAEQRSGDLVASGLIRFVPPPAGLVNAVARQQGDAAARLYAEGGYWYDAIMALSRSIARRPDWRLERADLLDQVGLMGPAAFDRSSNLASHKGAPVMLTEK